MPIYGSTRAAGLFGSSPGAALSGTPHPTQALSTPLRNALPLSAIDFLIVMW